MLEYIDTDDMDMTWVDDIELTEEEEVENAIDREQWQQDFDPDAWVEEEVENEDGDD